MSEVQEPKTIEALVAEYLVYRTQIEDLEAAHAEKLERLKDAQETISNRILETCNKLGVDTMRTGAGTVSRRVRERFWTSDWPQLYKVIEDHHAPFLLEQRIHNGNMKQFLQNNPDVLPPGLQVDSKYVIQVRKPNSK